MSARESLSLLSLRSKHRLSVIEEKISRIGMGRYQFLTLLGVSMCYFSESAQITSLSFIAIAEGDHVELSDAYMSLFGVAAMIGMSLGSLVAAVVADDFGRLKLIKLSLLLAFVSALLSSATTVPWIFISCQFLLGCGNGLGASTATPYILEICPLQKRGLYVVLAQLAFALGQLYVILWALSLKLITGSLNLYWISGLTSIPLAAGFILCLVVPRESVFFLLNNERYDAAVETLNYSAALNRAAPLSPQDIEAVSQYFPRFVGLGFRRITELFKREFCHITFLLATLWSITLYSLCGFLYSIQLTLDYGESEDEALYGILMGSLLQIPVLLLCVWLIQNNALGRRMILICVWFGISSLAVAGTLLVGGPGVYIVGVGMLILMGIAFSTMLPYTCEVYHTRLRVLGFGFHTVFSRTIAVSAPFVMLELTEADPASLFLGVAILSLVGFGVAICLPFETRGKDLDTPNQRQL